MASLCASMPRMGVFSGARVAAPQRSSLLAPVLQRRGAVQVVAAEQQKKKRTPQPVKRAQLSEERRMRNKPRKSAIATRMKKVMRLAEGVVKSQAADEQQVAALDKLVAEAYSEIDAAVSKGTLHSNTADRRKARVARFKRTALIAAGLYTPAPQQPGYFFYSRLQARKAAAGGN